MVTLKKFRKTVLVLFAAHFLCFAAQQNIFCQSGSVRLADLVGNWGFGNSLMLTYLDFGNGDYSHTGKDIYGIKYSIKPDSTFVYKFAARIGSRTIREWGNGVVVISAGFITFKFEQGASERYRFVSLTKDPKGATTLSVVQVGGGDKRLKCGHSISYFDCLGSQDWMLRSGTQ